MSRKPASLSASLVAVKGTGAPSPDMLGRGTTSSETSSSFSPAPTGLSRRADQDATTDETASGAPLNFRVSETFRREFKVYAAQHGLKLNELLRRSFEAYRRANGG